MSLENERTYKLLQLSVRVCRHCAHFQTFNCPMGPKPDDKNYKCWPWSSMSACEAWKPNERADEALQILTMRKLEGQDIVPAKDEKKKIGIGYFDDDV